jgi:DNA mismatch repair protein MSH2
MNTVLTNGFRLEIWTSEGRGNWVKDKVASPGNWTQVEDMLFSSSKTESAPVILALKVANKGDQTVIATFAQVSLEKLNSIH